LGQLADVCGGHPTSIEYVVLACNTIIDGADRKSVSDVIRSASRLIGAYRQVDDHVTLLKAILLGEKVRAGDLLIHNIARIISILCRLGKEFLQHSVIMDRQDANSPTVGWSFRHFFLSSVSLPTAIVLIFQMNVHMYTTNFSIYI
jgi:hypothetical protein